MKLLASVLTVLALPAIAMSQETAPTARPLLSPIFGSHMVLQREKPNRFWGWTAPGTTVKVTIAEQSASAVAGADGRWEATVTPPPAGGPYQVLIEGPQKITLDDVLVGDVWLCGGQSNMEWGLGQTANGSEEINAANYPNIRLYRVATQAKYAAGTGASPKGEWKVCSPDNLRSGFSAVGYFFGAKLHKETNIPIGLIQDCVGGTPVEAWMPATSLEDRPELRDKLGEIKRLHEKQVPEHGNFVAHWYDEYDIGAKEKWNDPALNDAEWTEVSLPGKPFAELGTPETPVLVYFRREIELPNPLPQGRVRLRLGRVERMDTAFINGSFVGASAWVENPRDYMLSPRVLVPGKNQITLRILKTKPNGGFIDPNPDLHIELPNGQKIPLAGKWKAKIAVDAKPPHPLPLGYENWPTMPSVLYNGMIDPVAPLAMTGAIWYQGESNIDNAFAYRHLLARMISDWRSAFRQGDFPFYIVQLPMFQRRRPQPSEDGWSEMRESQMVVANTVVNAGLAVTVDTGDANNIHPAEKRPVGERLAMLALSKHYGKTITSSGPTLESFEAVPGTNGTPGSMRLKFKHTDGGLVFKGNDKPEFAIAGSDRKWHWAQARIEGDFLYVSSPDVPNPEHVRYAWQANPAAALFNGAGLPASPFRTDGWPVSSERR